VQSSLRHRLLPGVCDFHIALWRARRWPRRHGRSCSYNWRNCYSVTFGWVRPPGNPGVTQGVTSVSSMRRLASSTRRLRAFVQSEWPLTSEEHV